MKVHKYANDFESQCGRRSFLNCSRGRGAPPESLHSNAVKSLLLFCSKHKKGTFWFSNSDRKAPPRIREVIFVCNLSARWCCVIPADAQQIICLIHDKKTVLTYKLCNNGCHTFTPECTHLFPALRSPRGLRQTCESKDSHTFSFSEKQLRNYSGQKEKLTSDTSGNRIDLWFFTFIFDLLFHFGGHTYQDKNDS